MILLSVPGNMFADLRIYIKEFYEFLIYISLVCY
jgi:hypothetical protein